MIASEEGRPADPASRKIVFLHVPKTAGTSLQQVARQVYGSGFRLVPSWFRDAEASRLALAKQVAIERARFIQGHVPLAGMPEDGTAGAAAPSLMTVLRDPVERALSQVAWGAPEHAAALHDRDRLLEAVRERLDGAPGKQVLRPLENLQTRMLSGLPLDDRPCDEEMFTAAANALRKRFWLVGITERHDDLLALLAHEAGWRDLLALPARTNPGRPQRSEIDPEIVALIEQNNAWDIELYRLAEQLFARRVREIGQHRDLLVEAITRGREILAGAAAAPDGPVWPPEGFRSALAMQEAPGKQAIKAVAELRRRHLVAALAEVLLLEHRAGAAELLAARLERKLRRHDGDGGIDPEELPPDEQAFDEPYAD